LQAFAVPVPNLTPPAVSSAGASLNITHMVELPNGNMIIEFSSTLGRTYTVVLQRQVLFFECDDCAAFHRGAGKSNAVD